MVTVSISYNAGKAGKPSKFNLKYRHFKPILGPLNVVEEKYFGHKSCNLPRNFVMSVAVTNEE